MLPVGMISGVASGALQSQERFLVANLLQTTGYALGQVVPVLLAMWIGPSLQVVLSTALLVRVATVVAMFIVVVRFEWPFDPFAFHMRKATTLFGYGAWVSVSSILNPILETFDQFLVGALLGARARRCQ